MDDLVSRQDVIDALMNDADWADAIPTIKSLPSSEPKTGKWVQGKYNWEWIEGTDGDLISRQDAIEAIMGEPTDAHYPSWYAQRIKSLPSQEPNTKCIAQIRIDRDDMEDLVNGIIEKIAEPKIGKWVWDDKGYFHCDQCGKKPNDQTRVTNFCPNCGSFNGGEEDD